MLFVGNLFRYSIFSMHWIFIIYNIIPIFSYNIFIFPLVIASWKLNDDYCIFTQLEEKYLGKTLFLQENKDIQIFNDPKNNDDNIIKY